MKPRRHSTFVPYAAQIYLLKYIFLKKCFNIKKNEGNLLQKVPLTPLKPPVKGRFFVLDKNEKIKYEKLKDEKMKIRKGELL